MFGASKVRIEKQLLDRIKRYARIAGYSSPDEFITHALERALAEFEESQSDEEIKQKLKGLGYIS